MSQSGGFADQGGGFADQSNKVNVRLIDNSGSGSGRTVQVDRGKTLLELFRQEYGLSANPNEYFIRVNRDTNDPTSTYVLQDGDTISITAKKVKGAEGGGFADLA